MSDTATRPGSQDPGKAFHGTQRVRGVLTGAVDLSALDTPPSSSGLKIIDAIPNAILLITGGLIRLAPSTPIDTTFGIGAFYVDDLGEQKGTAAVGIASFDPDAAAQQIAAIQGLLFATGTGNAPKVGDIQGQAIALNLANGSAPTTLDGELHYELTYRILDLGASAV